MLKTILAIALLSVSSFSFANPNACDKPSGHPHAGSCDAGWENPNNPPVLPDDAIPALPVMPDTPIETEPNTPDNPIMPVQPIEPDAPSMDNPIAVDPGFDFRPEPDAPTTGWDVQFNKVSDTVINVEQDGVRLGSLYKTDNGWYYGKVDGGEHVSVRQAIKDRIKQPRNGAIKARIKTRIKARR